MPKIATSTEAGRAVAQNATAAQAARLQASRAARAQAQADLKAHHAAEALFPETVGAVPLATVPEPPPAAPEPTKAAPRAFRFSTDIRFKGRVITVYADGMSLSDFSALLDAHGFAPVDGES